MQFPSRPLVDDISIREFWMSAFILPALTVADELGLFDLLEHHGYDETALVQRLQLNETATNVLIATLKSLGLIVERHRLLELTNLSRYYLVRTSPYYWGPLFHWFKEIPLSHERLLHAVRGSGGQVSDTWEKGELGIEQAAIIAAAMNSLSMIPAMGLAAQVDLRGIDAVLDIGGGAGCYSLAMATANNDIQFDIADLPAVCVQARKNIERFYLKNTVGIVEFNMFTDEWPQRYGAFLFANILHDWDEHQCAYLVQNCFQALPVKGKILIVEMLINEAGDWPPVACLFSMSMILNTRGKQFKGSELRLLLVRAGFVDIRIQELLSGYSLIEAAKPA